MGNELSLHKTLKKYREIVSRHRLNIEKLIIHFY